VSSSASTVPQGAVQIEAGGGYSRTSIGGACADREFTLDFTLRAGLTDRMEIRLDGQPLVVTRGQQDDTGIGDIALQAKYRFLNAPEGGWWPALAMLPFVKFPTAHAPHGANRPDFGLIGIASFALTWKLGLAQGAVSAALSRDIGERWSTYVEIFYTSPDSRGARDSVGFDAGVQFFVTPYLVLDAAGQTSLAGPGPDYAFRTGLSVRFGR
jgi:hypothetical protein